MRASMKGWTHTVLLIAAITVAGGNCEEFGYAQQNPAEGEPSVRVVSVSLDRSLIHKTLSPNGAILSVIVDVRGRVPKGSTATVEAGSYSGNPPRNGLVYEPTERIIPLTPGRTTVTFDVRADPKTTNGSVVIAASIGPTTNGIKAISLQPEFRQWRTQVETRDP